MAYPMNRRSFLLGSATFAAAGCVTSLVPLGAMAAPLTSLIIDGRTIAVNARIG